jgi:preprotein translocase subunit SecG
MDIVFLVIQIVIAVLLIAIILVQRTSSDGLSGLSGGSSNMGGVFSHKAAGRFLGRTTAVLIAGFFINSLILANLSHKQSTAESLTDALVAAESKEDGAESHHHSHPHAHHAEPAPVVDKAETAEEHVHTPALMPSLDKQDRE